MEYVDVGNFYSFELVPGRPASSRGPRVARRRRIPAKNPRARSLLVAARFSRRCFVATIRLRAISDSLRKPWASLTFESMRENLRGARRRVTTGRYAVEDFVADAALK